MRKYWLLRVLLYIMDVCLVNLGFFLAFALRFGGYIPPANFGPYLQLIPHISFLVIVFLAFFDLYGSSWQPPLEILYSILISVLLINVVTMALTFLTRGFAFPRTVFLIAALLQTFFLGAWRLLWQSLLEKTDRRRKFLVVGANGEGHSIAQKLVSLPGRRYNVIGVIDAENETAATTEEAISATHVVCIDASLSKARKEEIISRCLEEDKEVLLVPDFYDILVHSASVDRVDDFPVFRIERLSLTSAQQFVKRTFDLILASILFLVTLPLTPLIALAVRFFPPGPVFYIQERVGLNGKKFHLIKFRTMVKDAEKYTGPVLATENDPRLTRVGRILRAMRLDELPQILNILKGDMSFVGPRPERPFFVDRFSESVPGYTSRLKVKPGITGLAQVQGKYDTNAADKLRYDLYYIRNYSPLLDLQIILQTLRVVLMPGTAKGTSMKVAVPVDPAANGRGVSGC